MAYDGFGWRPYVPVSVRRQQAKRELERLAKKKGYTPSPIVIEGRRIAATFWGRSWCENLERYSDYASRLPRGLAEFSLILTIRKDRRRVHSCN